MIDLEKIHEMWKEDCKINEKDLSESSINTPMLHSKYLQFYSLAKLQLKRAEQKQYKLLQKKWLYYNGKMDQQQIEDLGWEFDPFDGLRVLKGEMDYYYNADTDIQKSEERIHYLKSVIETLKEILENLKWRHQNIKNIIEYRKFESGG